MCLQRKRFRFSSDKSIKSSKNNFLPDMPVEELKREKLKFFKTKVFCEDLSSDYHYEKFHKNKSKEFPDETSLTYVLVRDYYF